MSKALELLNEIKSYNNKPLRIVPTDKKFDEAIAELEAMETEIKNLSSKCAEIAYDFENAVNEIELLKQCVEEAIKRPMGVEPSIYSDYKMSKENA